MKTELLIYAKQAKKLGYKVFYPERDNYNWFYITDGFNICYCQYGDYFGGFKLSSVYKPTVNFGDGSIFHKNSVYEMKNEDIQRAFNFVIGDCATKGIEPPKFYSGWDEYQKKYWTKLIELND